MANDYIPADDAGLVSWATVFTTKLGNDFATYGFTEAEETALTDEVESFASLVTSANTAKTTAQSTTQAKNTGKADLVPMLRSAASRLQVHPAMSDMVRSQFGITVRDTTPTAVTAPTSAPIIWVDTKDRLRHTVHFYDELTPNSKAKPNGVHGCEIYRKIGGTAPASVAECEFLGLDTATPYVIDYGAESGGLMIYYLARWATRSGLTGPTAGLQSATVVA
jgi:hypothetical protein